MNNTMTALFPNYYMIKENRLSNIEFFKSSCTSIKTNLNSNSVYSLSLKTIVNLTNNFNISKYNNGYDSLYKKIFNKLTYLLKSDENTEELIQFIITLNNTIYFKDLVTYCFSNFNEYQKYSFISIIMYSDINVFASWYKECLFKCINSKNKIISKKANDIFEYYKKEFEEIKCM